MIMLKSRNAGKSTAGGAAIQHPISNRVRLSAPAAAAQVVPPLVAGSITMSPGAFYAPYVPLHITDLDMPTRVPCVVCGSDGELVTMQGKDEMRDIAFCRSCMKTMNIMDWIFTGELASLFPETNPREDCEDGIVWRVDAGAKVWPIYTRVMDGVDTFYVPKPPKMLERAFFCHDSLLYKDTVKSITEYRGGYGLSRGEELYVYQLHKIHHDGVGWAVGFILDGKHLIAHDVEMTDDEPA